MAISSLECFNNSTGGLFREGIQKLISTYVVDPYPVSGQIRNLDPDLEIQIHNFY